MTTKNTDTPATASAAATAGQVHDAVQREITAGIEAMARSDTKRGPGKTVLSNGTVVEHH